MLNGTEEHTNTFPPLWSTYLCFAKFTLMCTCICIWNTWRQEACLKIVDCWGQIAPYFYFQQSKVVFLYRRVFILKPKKILTDEAAFSFFNTDHLNHISRYFVRLIIIRTFIFHLGAQFLLERSDNYIK